MEQRIYKEKTIKTLTTTVFMFITTMLLLSGCGHQPVEKGSTHKEPESPTNLDIVRITGLDGVTRSVKYDSSGRKVESSMRYPNGKEYVQTYSYDKDGQLKQRSHYVIDSKGNTLKTEIFTY